jgi:hypothetical protein
MEECTWFFRINDGKPACGGAYCKSNRDNNITCPIKPAWGSNVLKPELKKGV